MEQSTLTLKFRGLEADALNKMVRSGLFNTKSEAIRSALVHYSIEVGIIDPKNIWKQIQKFPKRNVSPKQLARELELLEDEA